MKREELSHNYYHTADELEHVVSDYIDFFNSFRPLRKLGTLTPDEYEEQYQNLEHSVENEGAE